jgi:tRNA-specific 2-thiouridylase
MEKILVALSGGVDSSIAAARLVEQGYSVEGATMVFEGVEDDDVNYAREAAAALGIKFQSFDLSLPYQEMIIKDFVAEYQAGRTPNPCVRCNQFFKFGFFLQRALNLGFDRIATGHYARAKRKKGVFQIERGRDRNEQSYFLYRLNQYQLSKTILPLADLTKVEVRKIARDLKLPNAQRKKSQDICFLPGTDYNTYLREILPENPGPIVDMKGREIGRHKGVVFYTIGQRRGIGIGRGRPYYVVRIDARDNIIQVGDKEDVFRTGLVARDYNFTFLKGLNRTRKVLAKPRYFAPLSPARIRPMAGAVRVEFDKPQWALTPGQSVVFYQGNVLLGGGVIDEITP